jgi:hypothetical protein
MPLTRVLRQAGISRTAYYSLLRRESVLPKSLLKLAEALHAPPSRLLDESSIEQSRAERRMREARRIVRAHREVNFEDVWHTLVLLELPPDERLRRALRRGRARTS